MEEFSFTAWEEVDGEFSLYDDESGAFMSHYVTKDEIIDRFKVDVFMDHSIYRIDFRMMDDHKDKEYVLVPVK